MTKGDSFRSVVLCVLFVLAAGPVFAAEMNFSAAVDRTTVGLGEQLQLVVTVEGANTGAPRPQLPDLPDFTNYGSTSSSSTSISVVNGRMSRQQTVSFIYVLAPKRVGTLTIAPVRLNYSGTTYQTQPIEISVTKEAQVQPRQQQPMPDPFGQRRGAPAATDAVLVASADRSTVYIGEQVAVSYTFYSNGRVGNLSLKEPPSFTGFWVEKLFEARDLKWRTAMRNGRQYNAATIKEVALFPTQAGTLTVDKMTLAGQSVVPGFFFDENAPFEAASDPIRITARALPDEGKPADFSGGVGDFTLEAKLSGDKSDNGEPLTLDVVVTGTGNIGIIGEPQLTAPAGVKLLSPEAGGSTRNADGRIAGTRKFSYPVIPQADGRHVMPEITMSFFNPKTGGYYTRKTEPVAFVATGATGTAQFVEGPGGMKVLGTDIEHIKPVTGRVAGAGAVGWWTWLFYPAGLVVLFAGFVAGRHRRRLDADRGYARRSRSSRLVKRRLSEASKLLAAGSERDFYTALNQAAVGYVGDRYNIEAHGMTGDQLRAELVERSVDPDTVSALLALIADCDAARFSPGMAQCSPQETLRKAGLILQRL